MGIGFIDVEREHALEYNRWWDITMGPENAALPELAAARRYVAPPELQALRDPGDEEIFQVGRATYCHVYMFASEDVGSVMQSMGALAKRLGKQGRGFGRGRSSYQGAQRLARALVRPGLPVDPVAVPYLGHVAIQLQVVEVADDARQADVLGWYDETHLPDLLETPGFLAAMRLEPVEPERRGRFTILSYLDEPPERALAAWRQRLPELRERGRLPCPGGAARPVLAGPYRPLLPLQYDFL